MIYHAENYTQVSEAKREFKQVVEKRVQAAIGMSMTIEYEEWEYKGTITEVKVAEIVQRGPRLQAYLTVKLMGRDGLLIPGAFKVDKVPMPRS